MKEAWLETTMHAMQVLSYKLLNLLFQNGRILSESNAVYNEKKRAASLRRCINRTSVQSLNIHVLLIYTTLLSDYSVAKLAINNKLFPL